MNGSFKLTKLFGIDLEINISWLLVFALFSFTLAQQFFPSRVEGLGLSTYWSMGITTTIFIFASVIIHELAHSLMAIKNGIPIKKITLFIFGGVAQMEKEPEQPGVELKIALVGPAASLVLSLLSWIIFLLLPGELAMSHVIWFLARINFIVGTINLIPAFPLDGGRVLRAVLWKLIKSMLRATKIAVVIGNIFAFFAIALGFFMLFRYTFIWGLWYIFLGWMLYQAGQASYVQLVFHQSFKGVPVSRVMSPDVHTVSPGLTLVKLVEEFYRYKFGAFPVVENGDLRGMVTFHQIREVPQEKWPATITAQIMTPEGKLFKVSPRQEAVEVMMKMAAENMGRILVVEDNKLVGILSRTDLMKLISMHLLLGIEK
ncbi:MAG: CBS domain-containing protein [Dethiobacter sp.]|jgi:Zn-dependent protease/CBS domain-containing protein|nr:MAG: CBS domain-containing protein [Dethiobacter sp.]